MRSKERRTENIPLVRQCSKDKTKKEEKDILRKYAKKNRRRIEREAQNEIKRNKRDMLDIARFKI